jgi:hypothetical protein
MLCCRAISVEVLQLLRAGWTVVAFDEAPTPAPQTARLTFDSTEIEEAALPAADLIYTAATLPFRPYKEFFSVWARIVRGLRPGGWFAGYLLGDRDSWADDPNISTFSRERIVTLLSGFRIDALREQDEHSACSAGVKHWHVFQVIAHRRA